MDRLTFISTIIKAIAWPVTLIAFLFLVRKDLPRLVRSLRRLKFKGVELEFGEAVKELAAETSLALSPPSGVLGNISLLPATGPIPQAGSAPQLIVTDHTEESASPRGEILEAWLFLEKTAQALLGKNNGDSISTLPHGSRLVRELLRLNLIDERQAAIFDELRRLRNEAVHMSAVQFTKQTARYYALSALQLARYLESATASR